MDELRIVSPSGEKIAVETFQREGLLDEVLDIGLDFEVGSKGDRLSGGQKQKVAIARALLKDTPILIMDEATASLDNTSQAKIHELLETKYKGTKTIIAVAHLELEHAILYPAPCYDRIENDDTSGIFQIPLQGQHIRMAIDDPR